MEENQVNHSHTNQKEIGCNACGAKLKYEVGTEVLACEYCGSTNEIEKSVVDIQENSFEEVIASLETNAETIEEKTVKCGSCGAATTFDASTFSGSCDFCASPIVINQEQTTTILKPEYLLPFKIKRKEAFEEIKNWVGKLWFAPNDLMVYAKRAEKLSGIYTPYWTYDSQTYSHYTGQKGIDYQDTESYTTTEGGKSVTKTRTVTKTRWYYVSGHIEHFFDDVMVCATNSLPAENVDKLEPWDLQKLEGYKSEYLSGFKGQTYQVDLKQGFSVAKSKIEDGIRHLVHRQIGGDRQRIDSLSTQYSNISFKHILLPVWVSAYKYNNKVYQILINGRTGEVQGERPYSALKIALAVVAVVAVVGIIYYFKNQG